MHSEMIERMMLALDDELSADEQQQLQSHLLMCGACAEEWAGLRAAHEALTQAITIAPRVDFSERVMMRVVVAATQKKSRRRDIFGLILFVLGTLGVAVMIFAAPLSILARPETLALVVREFILLGHVAAAIYAWITTAMRVLGQMLGSGPLLIMAILMLTITMGWARVMSGQALPKLGVS